jgi:hypothetical protein
MLNRLGDPRTEDTIVFEVLRTPRAGSRPEVVGRASFRGGRSRVDAPEQVAVPIQELLERPFVDRVQADERPRGYRRSGHGMVDLLVPGMAEHFIARMRGLWLSYPDGSVVTAREAGEAGAVRRPTLPEPADANPPVVDPTVRLATLAASDERLGARPLVRANPPEPGLRPGAVPRVRRTDCGWIA